MKVAVLGAGYMGCGIAQVSARGGHDVHLWDMTEELTQRGKASIAKSLDGRIAKGKETEENKAFLLARIFPTADLAGAVADADLILEAVVEDRSVKRELFAKVEGACPEGAFLASNTSSIPITELAAGLERPERFLGMHFFGPVPAMKLLEIIRGGRTGDAAVELALKFAASIGKTGVVCKKDTPGFIVNRINYAMRLEAYRCMHEGVASIEDIDTAMRLGLNHPMGPFELNDMAGLDVGLAGLRTMYERTGEERWCPPPEVLRRVEAGELGRKSGRGWYDYSTGEKKARPEF